MKLLNISMLSECEYIENTENKKSCVASFFDITKGAYESCCDA